MSRFCASCGTEVDDTAVFCPTCGRPIDQDTEAEMPAAPAWPDVPREEGVRRPESEPEPVEATPEPVTPWVEGPDDQPTRIEERPPAPSEAPAPDTDRPRGRDSGRPSRGLPSVNLPFTAPVTLSAWLIGVGSALGAVGLVIALVTGFLNAIDLLLLLALLAIAATVFLSANVPAIPQLRLATLVIVLIGFGIALDRVGFRGGGAGELLLFLGTAAAAIGAILVELGRDQPLGGPGS